MTTTKKQLFLAALILVSSISGSLAGPLDHWTWRLPTPQGNSLYGITFGKETFVAVGELGTVVVSTNGDNWNVVPGLNGTFSGFVYYFRDNPENAVGNGYRSQDPGGYFVELGYFLGGNGIQQTFSTDPNQPYLVTFWLGSDVNYAGQVHVSAGDSAADYSGPFHFPIRRTFWEEHSFSFTSDGSGMTTLTFQNPSGTIPALDTISIVPVPEPHVWALLGLGALLLVSKGRRCGRVK